MNLIIDQTHSDSLQPKTLDFYYTFGHSHRTKSGKALHGYYVKVTAEDGARARQIFIENFAKAVLARPDHFAFEYSSEAFNERFCPKGLYCEVYEGGIF